MGPIDLRLVDIRTEEQILSAMDRAGLLRTWKYMSKRVEIIRKEMQKRGEWSELVSEEMYGMYRAIYIETYGGLSIPREWKSLTPVRRVVWGLFCQKIITEVRNDVQLES